MLIVLITICYSMSCLNKIVLLCLRSCAWRSFLLLSPLLAKIPLDKASPFIQSANHLCGSARDASAFILKIGSTLAAIGGYHTLAGATQISINQNPSPAPTGTNVIAVIQAVNAPLIPQSYKAEGELPPGLRIYVDAEHTLPASSNVINAPRFYIKGQAYEPGDYPITVTAYRGRNADGQGFAPFSAQLVIKVVGESIPQPQSPAAIFFEQVPSTGAFSFISWDPVAPGIQVEIFYAPNLADLAPVSVVTSGTGAEEVAFPESFSIGSGDHFFWARARRSEFIGDLVGPHRVRVLPAPATISASQAAFDDRINVQWASVARTEDYFVHVEGQEEPIITTGTSVSIPAPAGVERNITVFARYEGIQGIGVTTTGSTKVSDKPPARKFLSGFLDAEDGFQFNAMGFSYEGYYPFIYLFSYGSWIYVFNDPANDTEGWYLYDFHHGAIGFTLAEAYPYYFGLSEGKPEFVDLSLPAE